MKRVILNFLVFAVLVVSAAFTSCNTVVEDYYGNTKITMTTGDYREIDFSISGSGPFSIDWDDGMVGKGKLELWEDLSVKYAYASTRTSHAIIIYGDITYMDCNSNLISLDVSNNTVLKELRCRYRLTSLDASGATALTKLNLESNQLTSLNVSGATALTYLNCNNNELTSLDVSGSTALTYLNCLNNQLTSSALNALFETLHSNIGSKTIYIGGNPGTNGCDRSIATNKGWTVDDARYY
jgi:Leucine-rich repeat (LRR) protein